jgi:hypothetical protein
VFCRKRFDGWPRLRIEERGGSFSDLGTKQMHPRQP